LGGTRGRDIAQAAAIRVDSDFFAAVYDKAAGELLIYKNDNLVQQYPAFAGLPQGGPALTWWDDGTSLRLVVAGEASTISVAVAK